MDISALKQGLSTSRLADWLFVNEHEQLCRLHFAMQVARYSPDAIKDAYRAYVDRASRASESNWGDLR